MEAGMESSTLEAAFFQFTSQDTLSLITSNLDSFSIGRLYLCCNHKLVALLDSSVVKFDIHWPFKPKSLPKTPALVSRFQNLHTFGFIATNTISTMQYSITIEDIMMLPPSVTSITIASKQGEACFAHFNIDTTKLAKHQYTRTGYLDFSKYLPNLKSLDVMEYSSKWFPEGYSEVFDLKFVQLLPPTMTSLKVTVKSNWTESFVQALPRGLVVLELNNSGNIPASAFQYLPPCLDTLIAPQAFSIIASPYFKDLPRSLRKMKMSIDYSDPRSASDWAFLPSLTWLDLGYRWSMDSSLSQDHIDNLPESLKYLRIGTNQESAFRAPPVRRRDLVIICDDGTVPFGYVPKKLILRQSCDDKDDELDLAS